jgi:hypothetical protein
MGRAVQTVQGRTDGRTDTLLPARLRARAVREDELGWAAEKQRSGEERRVGEWPSGRAAAAVGSEGGSKLGAEKYEGNKGKSVGAPFFPLVRFYSYNSLCSLAPKPRRTLQVLAEVN